MATMRQNDMREGQGDVLGGLMLGAAVSAVSSNIQPIAPTVGQAPLSRQSTEGWQRYCGYLTPSGMVQIVLPLGRSCPATYAY